MASLTEASYYSRIIIKWGFVGVVGLMIGRMIVGSLIAWYKATHPVIPPPTLGFGVLPNIEFPSFDQPALTYKLETVDGSLPVFESQAEVIFVADNRPNLLAMERSIQEVGNLGFKSTPEKLSDLSYRWRNLSPLASSLTMQIYDGRFVMETEWMSNPNFLTEKFLPSNTQAVKDAKDVVRKLGKQVEDLNDDKAKITFLRGTVTGYQVVPSLSEADFVQVDLFRTPLKDKYAFVTPIPDQGVVRVIISGNVKLAKYARINYNYFPIDYTSIETYPLKPVELAWQELNEGKGFIAQVDKGYSEIIIRKVMLAYYDSFNPQRYVQPVYVFTGDNDYVGYVPALQDLSNYSQE